MKNAMKIMVYSSKGGSGKSTTVLQIAREYSKKGYRVCVIDCDPQANLTGTLLKDRVIEDGFVSMTDLFERRVDAEKVSHAIYPVNKNLDMIGSTMSLVDSERNVSADPVCDKGRVLEKIVNCIEKDYDLILMDFNPYPTLLTTNGLMVCDFVLIPTTCDKWGFDGMIYTLGQISEIVEWARYSPIPYKILINMKGRNNDDKEFQEAIESQLEDHEIFKTSIHYQSKPFKNKDESVMDFKKGETTVGQEWKAVLDELEREVINHAK